MDLLQYAMLAGYLPFDDDPANPEGDNINLLYKYITTTPLTFPEYVTPHARDLLRRILVPEPRTRADLFEVARHTWLSDFSHVVGFIGSSTKSDRDIATSAMRQQDEPSLGRSASVREPTGRSPASAGGVPQKKQPNTAEAEQDARNRQQRDAKRRTVQLEYVAPKDSASRGDASPTGPASTSIVPSGAGRTRARGDSQGPVEVPQTYNRDMPPQVPRKELPNTMSSMGPPARPSRDQARAASDAPAAFSNQGIISGSRPNTGNTLGSARLPSRGNSYSQPAVPTPSNANAQGQFSQPKSGSGYIISSPVGTDQGQMAGSSRPVSSQNLAQYQQQQQQYQQPESQPQRVGGHKRSSTLGSIGDRLLGRSSSRRTSQQSEAPNVLEKRDRKYPPVSMRNPIADDAQPPRQSMESSRRTSFGFMRKNSDVPSTAESNNKRSSRRFSLLPASWSMNNFGGGKKDQSYEQRDGRPESKGVGFGRGSSRSPSMSTTNSTNPLYYEADREAARVAQQQQQRRAAPGSMEKALPPQPGSGYGSTPPPVKRKQYRDDGYGGNLLEPATAIGSSPAPQEPIERYYTPQEDVDAAQYNSTAGGNYIRNYASGPTTQSGFENGAYARTEALPPQPGSSYSQSQSQSQYPPGSSSSYAQSPQQYRQAGSVQGGVGVRPSNRKFGDDHGHGGSSSATRRVMDFFRRRGKERGEA